MKEAFEKIKERLGEKRERANKLHGKPHMDFGTLVGWASAMDEALSIVSEVEAEFGKDINVRGNGWIPCSERLPKEKGAVLVTYENVNDEVRVEVTMYEPKRKSFWVSPNVIAWMPLPEPYKQIEKGR